ncbi:MAG: NAD(P)-dependent oxidoreductase [Paracoccaceae bacterium]|nr:NAD(P)-dependent oxidoreductase [Paracoccaceae bacterium]
MRKINLEKKICFIGLGTMGGYIAKNIKHYYPNISVFDRASSKRKKFVALGYKFPQNLFLAAKKADILFTILPTSKIVHDVIFDPDNEGNSVINSVSNNCLFIDMTTGSIDDFFILKNKLEKMGHRLIDAPVGRSPREAKIGKSLIMAGGTVQNIKQAKPVFETFADTIIHVGEIGSGLKLKLVNNYMAMINHVLTGQVLAFAKSVGLDRKLTVEVLSTTAAGKGQLLTNFPEKVLAGDISPDFSINMGIKDLNMALELAENSNFDPSFGKLAHLIFSKASLAGMENQDCTAILNFFDSKASKPKN